jgi:nucleoid-associated protein YgaU
MNTKLTCPVCSHPEIEGEICPNCETDLSVVRMLTELPPSVSPDTQLRKAWVPVFVAILMLLLVIRLGFASNSWLSEKSPPTATSSNLPSRVTSNSQQPQAIGAYGFRYTVRPGDSLSLIARRFYGNKDLWPLIVKANPSLQGRETALEVGEVLLVPNLEENSPS